MKQISKPVKNALFVLFLTGMVSLMLGVGLLVLGAFGVKDKEKIYGISS